MPSDSRASSSSSSSSSSSEETPTAPRPLSHSIILHDHCGSNDAFQKDRFWTSKPALLIHAFLVLSVLFQKSLFLLGVCAVFLFQAAIVVSKWAGFVARNPHLAECIELTKNWIKFWRGHAEAALQQNDRARKAAAATFLKTFGTTTLVASKYLRARQKVVIEQSMNESQRFTSMR